MSMGCSRGLLTLINKISMHASTKAKVVFKHSATLKRVPHHKMTIDTKTSFFDPPPPPEIQKYAKISSEIGMALLSLKQKLPESSARRKDLERIAQIKHLAALLYLTERLGHIKPKGESASACCSVSLNAMAWEVEDLGLWGSTAQGKSSRARKHQADGRQSGEDAHPPTPPRVADYERISQISVIRRASGYMRDVKIISYHGLLN